ncbi:aspartyl protease family protein [Algoriphagus sediminis]|uniref:Aspartyl protease family protein n=1 Tax=Algoriphagus sediminis TaxID=3057113 RepID=A0ABT7YC01_9BACT|nr:aspartyl protease family protein [Algoriphagus sediminis]MDN3204013.1 aspartyl protease family protein [Algoriphagus sediminis]
MVRIVIFSLFFAFSTSAKVAAQVPGFFLKDESKRKATIPFYASNSLMIIPVSVNGNTPVNFMIDTGVRANILFSKDLGDAMGLEYSRKIDLVGADGSATLGAYVSPINNFDLGPVEGRLQSLLVLEEDFLEIEAVIGTPVYGILGYEFFKYNPIRINYDDSKLDFFREDAMKWRPPFYHKFDLSIEDNKPYVDAKIKQRNGETLEAKLLVDTGANHGLLLNAETTDEIVLPNKTIETQIGQSLGGVIYGNVGRVDRINLAGLKMDEVLTSYPEENEFSYVVQGTGRQGSLGAEIFGRTRLILDYPRGRMFMKKGRDFYSPFEFDMSGIFVKKITTFENRFYVGQVRKNSPAEEQGIKANDEILSINKIPTFIWELSEVIQLFRSEEGKEIELELRRYRNDDLNDYEDYRTIIKLKKQI